MINLYHLKLQPFFHKHDDSCCCGHEHEHHDSCCCGHEHEHHDSCCCGHEHEHEHHQEHEHHDSCSKIDNNTKKAVFILENLGCANCASRMEKKIQELPDVYSATITFATRQLRLSAEDPQKLLPEIQNICSSIESQVKVIPQKENISGAYQTKTYLLENLGCANCASKMETQIAELDGISSATITFATKQLRVTAKNPDLYLPQIRKICSSIESQVQVLEKDFTPENDSTAFSQAQASDSHKLLSNEQKELTFILVGAVLLVTGVILEHMGFQMFAILPVYVIAYLILGGPILMEAGRNILHGQIFDENFLMSVATLGAFAIQEFPEAVGVMLFYRVGEYFEHKAVDRSRSQIMNAVDMRPEVVNRLNEDQIQVIPAQDAHVGDMLLIRPGDRIPLDGVIIEGESRLDTSPITGEPVPVSVKPGDDITSGCVNTSGQLIIRVEKPLEESMVSRILDAVENAAASKPKIDRFITRFSRVYTPLVVFLAIATAVIPSLITGHWNYWVYTALTFLVMSCPCALVLSVPLAFFSGIGAGSKKGILFKGGVSIEALGNLGAVVMDKTGTITEGNFKLQKIVSNGTYEEKELLRICASCEQNSTHPIAVSIVTAARERKLALETPENLEEIAGHGIIASLKEGTVLCGNRKLMDANSILIDEMANETYGSEVFLAVNGKFAGYLLISDTIKQDAKSAIRHLKSLGLYTVMLTGDSENSASAVAEETGIDEVYAKLLPQDKLNILNKVRAEQGSVMFVGDGINDAPVLAGADVGAAMGSGADAAIEAADAVFMNSNVESIPLSIRIARSTNRIAMQNVVFALIIKIAVMILGLAGFANMWMAVFADTGVAMLCVLNSVRVLYRK
ncbi:MAG: heavy metal translocating P-type ATPase [Oliverpabstia sp.]|nr:heavy metal translocating P-type ATPase [Oliverpabstia sp.]